MSVWVEAGWDTSVIGSLSMRITELAPSIAVATTFTVNVTEGKYCHTDISSVVNGYTAIATALSNAADAASPTKSSYTFTWDGGSGKYSIAVSSGTTATMAVSFEFGSGADEERLAEILGYIANSSSSSESEKTPYFYLSSAMGAKSEEDDDYEPDGIVDSSEADDGTIGSMAPTDTATYSDFVFAFEPHKKTKSYKADADTVTGGTPWTFEDFVKHVRGDEPFLVVDTNPATTAQSVHKMRAKAGRFKPDRIVKDWNDAWSWQFQTYLLGRL